MPGTDANDHRDSNDFVPRPAGHASQLDWCVFLIANNEVNVDLRFTVATLDGNLLGVHNGGLPLYLLESRQQPEQFMAEITLQNTNDADADFATVETYACALVRQTRSDAPARTSNAGDFVDAVDDAQAFHIWRFLFPDRPPPPRHGAVPVSREVLVVVVVDVVVVVVVVDWCGSFFCACSNVGLK